MICLLVSIYLNVDKKQWFNMFFAADTHRFPERRRFLLSGLHAVPVL